MAKTTSKKAEVEEKTLSQKIREYFLSLKFEWQKVSFPTRKELTQSTIVVFLFTIIMMAVIAGYDFLMTVIFDNVILGSGS